MRWPVHPVESVPPSRFRPPFCPWPACRAHLLPGRGFHRHGSFRTRRDPRRIPRFLCLDCHRTCSRQTFSSSYYLKRPDRLAPVAAALVASSAHRQIARSLDAAKTSVTRLAERLGRHAILLHARALQHLSPLHEPVVHDHFEAFVHRQDQALGVGTAVGARTGLVYDLDPAPHRGAGRRPDRGPRPNEPRRLRHPYVTSIRRTMEALISLAPAGRRLELRVDGRQDYAAARASLPDPARIALRVFPNPPRGPKGSVRSPQAVARDRAMSPVDHLHQLIRHTGADHKRETLAFGRRLESVVGRLMLVAVWRNFLKGRSERKPDRTTPAMTAGLADRPWGWERVLSRRLFPSREEILNPIAGRIYRRTVTPDAPTFQRRHAI